MAQQTYNQILDMWRKLGNNHLQVKTFTVGDIFEVDANTVVFPQVHLITEQASMTPHQITYNFKLIAMDLVEPDESNEDDVLSDTMQYIQDFIAAFRNGAGAGSQFPMTQGEFVISDTINCQPFTERFDTSVSGWVADVQISVDYDASACDMAFS